MCLTPIKIRNPSRGLKHLTHVDTVSAFVKVPCGHCADCIRQRQMSVVQRAIMESRHNYLFFCTLTYNNEFIPSVTTSTGYTFHYSDWHDLQNLFKRIRNHNLFTRPFRYFAVSEYGSSESHSHRPHFHVIFFLPKYSYDNPFTPYNLEPILFKEILSNWCRNFGSKRVPDYRPLLTYVRRHVRGRIQSNYDLHYVENRTINSDESNVVFYASKYLLKPSGYVNRLQSALRLNLSPEEYNCVWNILKPRAEWSHGFGFGTSDKKSDVWFDSLDYLYDGLSQGVSSFDFPVFFHPYNSTTQPLAHYYYKFIPYNLILPYIDKRGVFNDGFSEVSELIVSNSKLDHCRDIINSQADSLDFLDSFSSLDSDNFEDTDLEDNTISAGSFSESFNPWEPTVFSEF